MTGPHGRGSRVLSVLFLALIGAGFLGFGLFEHTLRRGAMDAGEPALAYPAHIDWLVYAGAWLLVLLALEVGLGLRGVRPTGLWRKVYIGLLVSPLLLLPVMPALSDLYLGPVMQAAGYARCEAAEASDSGRFPSRHWVRGPCEARAR